MTESRVPVRPRLDRDRDLPAVGPRALVASAVLALCITGAAMTFAPDLAHHGRAGYELSGVVMSLADVLYLVGVVALIASGVVPRGMGWRVVTVLAVVGSAGVVAAEVALRVSFDFGTAAFSVIGPLQALGVTGVGVGVIRSGAWSGWRRFAWLVQGLYVPVVLVPALAAGGGQNLPALAGFHALVLLCGVAFAVEERRAGR